MGFGMVNVRLNHPYTPSNGSNVAVASRYDVFPVSVGAIMPFPTLMSVYLDAVVLVLVTWTETSTSLSGVHVESRWMTRFVMVVSFARMNSLRVGKLVGISMVWVASFQWFVM